MERIPEPELMLEPAQARAYAAADFSEPHGRFIALLRERCAPLPDAGAALDLGCGPGDVTLRFARAFPGWRVDGIDGSPAMLALARQAAVQEGLDARARFFRVRLPEGTPPRAGYDLVFSNSLLHHLAEPGDLWSALRRFGRAGARIFVMDLLRPEHEAEALALVARHAASEPEVLRRDFHRSLLAAYRPAEVRAQLCRAGLADLWPTVISDRHLAVWGTLAGGPAPPAPPQR
jgi:SAM-dependent methyltransferase